MTTKSRKQVDVDDIYTLKDVIAITGMSHKQVDDLNRKGVLAPSIAAGSGKGTRCLYSGQDVALLRVVSLMKEMNIGRTTLRAVIKTLQRHEFKQGDNRYLVVERGKASIVGHAFLLSLFGSKPSQLLLVASLPAQGV